MAVLRGRIIINLYTVRVGVRINSKASFDNCGGELEIYCLDPEILQPR